MENKLYNMLIKNSFLLTETESLENLSDWSHENQSQMTFIKSVIIFFPGITSVLYS